MTNSGAELNHELSNSELTPETALKKLIKGNQDFLAGKDISGKMLLEQVQATAAIQTPFAAIVTCIDSRVAPEIVFHQGIGDLFAARVGGNFINDDMLGGLEFAATLASPIKLIVVMGHTNCGAMQGACAEIQLGLLTKTLANLNPAVRAVARKRPGDSPTTEDFVLEVTEMNVALSMQAIHDRSLVLREKLDKGELKMVGAMYNMATGVVTFYNLENDQLVPLT